jgi:uncharacterized protein
VEGRAVTRGSTSTPADLRQPLTDKELDELEDVLVANETSLPWVEGLFSAILTGPDLVAPSAWLPLVFAEDAFENETVADRMLTLTMRLFNEVNATLQHDPRMLAPEPDDVDSIEAFCDGYLAGANLHAEWKDDAIGSEQLEGFRIVVGEAPADEATFEAQQRSVGSVVAALWAHWEPARRASVPEAPSSPPPGIPATRDAAKVGRNDPCACGSGKKYKKCCAN